MVEEIESLTKQFRRDQNKDFLINGQTFDQVNIAQKTKHEIDVQKQKERKKEERRQMMVQVCTDFTKKNFEFFFRGTNVPFIMIN